MIVYSLKQSVIDQGMALECVTSQLLTDVSSILTVKQQRGSGNNQSVNNNSSLDNNNNNNSNSNNNSNNNNNMSDISILTEKEFFLESVTLHFLSLVLAFKDKINNILNDLETIHYIGVMYGNNLTSSSSSSSTSTSTSSSSSSSSPSSIGASQLSSQLSHLSPRASVSKKDILLSPRSKTSSSIWDIDGEIDIGTTYTNSGTGDLNENITTSSPPTTLTMLTKSSSSTTVSSTTTNSVSPSQISQFNSSILTAFRPGTLNQLIRRLTPEEKSYENVSAVYTRDPVSFLLSNPDEESIRVSFFKSFMHSYRLFIVPGSLPPLSSSSSSQQQQQQLSSSPSIILLDKLFERYNIPRSAKLSSDVELIIKQRVCDVLKFWINEYSFDLILSYFQK